VSYPIARLLDGVNALVVERRIRHRQSATSSRALQQYLQVLPTDPLGPSSLELRPRRFNGRWGAESWKTDADGWVATRLPARGTPRGAVILLHGWLATRPQVAFTAGLAAPLRRLGIEVWVPRLPAHCERAPPGTISGERCLSADLVATGESLRQAVAETRALAVWLRGRVGAVGLWGVSLGGWVAALTLTTPTAIDAAVLWTPVVDPHDTMWESPLTSPIRGALLDAGVDRDLTAEVFRRYAPGHRRLQLKSDNVILIGAKYDNVVSSASLLELERRWGVSVRWFPHGHISVTCAPRPRRHARQALLSTLAFA
jgi:dienelactone hydrolase